MSTQPAQLDVVVQHIQAGRLSDAERLLQQIVAREPRHAVALHLLGVVCYMDGRHEQAVQWMRQSTGVDPTNPKFLSDLADALRTTNQFDPAIDACRRALAISPQHPEALNNLGATYLDSARPALAIAPLLQVVQNQPQNLPARYNLGRAYLESGDPQASIEHFQKALMQNTGFMPAYAKMLDAMIRAGRYTDADQLCEVIALAAPDPSTGWALAASVLRNNHRPHKALQAYERALQHAPTNADLLTGAGACLDSLDRLCEAEQYFRRALQIDPRHVAALNALGGVLWLTGRPRPSLQAYQDAAQRAPVPAAWSNQLLLLQYQPGVTAQSLLEPHVRCAEQLAVQFPQDRRPYLQPRQPARRLRIGFSSSHFNAGPLSNLLLGMMEKLDRAQFDLFFYSDSAVPDAQSQRFAQLGTWRNTGTFDHRHLADVIRADAIDVLFDLTGHTGENRMPVFSLKPAPVQITWLGYEGTTGLQRIDYILADETTIPPGEEHCYAETPLRLAGGYLCYDPHPVTPPVAPPPVMRKGHITFGSFSTPAKYNLELFGDWAKIMNQTPGSRLLLKYRGLDEPQTQEHFRGMFTQAGGDGRRIDFTGWTDLQHSLGMFGEVDVSLDTFPFNGSATTCDSLWMGVPVVTQKGGSFAGRHGAVHLVRLGLPELIADSHEQFVRVAVALARDTQRLSALRGELRSMVQQKLCDGQRLAEEWSIAVRTAWTRWCHRQGT